MGEGGGFGDDGGAFLQDALQPGGLLDFEHVHREIERVGLAIVSGVHGGEADFGGAPADASFGVGNAETVLLGVFFETADGGGDRHGGGEEVGHRLRGGLGRALRVFAEHRRGGDLGE